MIESLIHLCEGGGVQYENSLDTFPGDVLRLNPYLKKSTEVDSIILCTWEFYFITRIMALQPEQLTCWNGYFIAAMLLYQNRKMEKLQLLIDLFYTNRPAQY